MSKELVVALVGNPNCGKTSLFNALTGSRQHVGNWPGVTVEKKEGKLKFEGREINVVDLPGTYSLGAYSEDEVVARNFILEGKPDVIINVIDSTNIERNLYLTVQLLEMTQNVVLALNMTDEAKLKKIEIDIEKLSKKLGVPIVSTVATKKQGVNDLIKKAIDVSTKKQANNFKLNYGKEVDKSIQELSNAIQECCATNQYPATWTAIKLLENDEYILNKMKQFYNNGELLKKLSGNVDSLTNDLGYDPESYIIDKRYEFIEQATKNSVKRAEIDADSYSDKIDRVLTNKWLGLPIFAIIMFLIYQITMVIGNDLLGGYVGGLFDSLGEWAGEVLPSIGAPAILISLIVEGIIGGMGAILGFVPLIVVMYLLISLLEDSGYMARAAYVMDKFMNSIGLHGKTAVSFIISSGCNVAGIMSTRTLESKKDRMIAILINPFISCGARLPVYALFAGAFFGEKKVGIFSASGVVVFSLYVLGITVAILVGKLLSTKVFKQEESYFVMELPPYRIPTFKSILIHMWEKAESFVKKAGTIIFAVVLLTWALANLPFGVEPGTANSVLGKMGSLIAPIFKPAGFGTWQAGAALITGVGAKEAVVATLATLYGVGEGPGLVTAIQQAFTPLTAYAFMVMTLLYVPCGATLGAVKRETNSRKWMWAVALYTTFIGWLAAVLVYQIGKLLGLG